jgi:hypothetical protein
MDRVFIRHGSPKIGGNDVWIYNSTASGSTGALPIGPGCAFARVQTETIRAEWARAKTVGVR